MTLHRSTPSRNVTPCTPTHGCPVLSILYILYALLAALHPPHPHKLRVRCARTITESILSSRNPHTPHTTHLSHPTSKPLPPSDLVKLFKGHVSELLRHPCGVDVLDDLYNVSPPPCRNALCAELYGREFSLFGGVSTPAESISHLSQLLGGVDAAKRQAVVASLYKGLAPVVEKALLHPVMTHRLLRELLTEAPG